MAQAGLKRWSARATATVIVAANIPDIDVLAIPFGRNIELRRGITHGVIALALWPFVLALVMWLWERWRPSGQPARYWPLVALSAIGVVTHPFLDFLNNYGLRWLMPFENRWFYGDSLFIVDPWLYLVLGGALLFSVMRERRRVGDWARPARVGLAISAAYVGSMMVTTQIGRLEVARALAPTPLANARFMATAEFANPFRKAVIVDAGPRYRIGTYWLFRPNGLVLDVEVDKGVDLAAQFNIAKQPREVAAFLHWARFPVVVRSGDDRVAVYDLRYATGGRSWASVELTGGPAGTRSPAPSPDSTIPVGGAPPR